MTLVALGVPSHPALARPPCLFEYPLAVIFRLEQDEQTVAVLHIWRFRKRTA
jgi:hypothetical protein